MYVLDFLSDPKCDLKRKDSLTGEYRLLCSGTVHRDVLGDPYKSEIARRLLDDPLSLFAVGRPLDSFPLELSLEITVPHVVESHFFGDVPGHHHFHPDNEVANDFAALLSLLFRRLVTVAGKATERHSNYDHPMFGKRPFPLPLVSTTRRIAWAQQPWQVTYAHDGPILKDYDPIAKAVDPLRLTGLLTGLPGHTHAESIVASCRLYAVALELIHERPDISYQLLISSVETVANSALEKFEPDDDAKVKHKEKVYKAACQFNLGDSEARQLAIVACKGEYWATKKFKKFLIDNVDESVWSAPDDLFRQVSAEILPKKDEFEKTLGRIYDARSKATHRGEQLPFSAFYTGGPRIDSRAAHQLYGNAGAFPPVIWFERIVNSAICCFWERISTDG